MKAHVLVGVLTMVGLVMGKAPVASVRTCHQCFLEDPSIGCISGSEKCTISPSSPCMVITIYQNTKVRFHIRGCGQYHSFRCQEKHITYHSDYWYKANCCQYDYCNSWSSAQHQNTLPGPPGSHPGMPPSASQIKQFYQALNLSLPQHGFHAHKVSEGPDSFILPLELGLSIADLRQIYMFLNSSGLLVLPQARP
ncbi:lymphocyte antigen 6 complex locus protein G5b [Apodemus sylvaticus]|uniref:lymphocyte antigen 6 complex locus protein G5b n=1 Tax=Apodemus sylvaticus TaxID=10129 RepID=UPI002244A1C7|nr:lymphocyte antigen 6 complex locus protein G5b [Apodemus sylvaticus]